jgi:hypothetical protein
MPIMTKYVFDQDTKFNWRNLPLLYIYIFQFIAEKAGKFDQEISSELIIEIWHRHVYHIPRIYDFYFLEEMEYFGFLKKERQQKYIFYGSKIEKAIDRLSKGAYELDTTTDAPLLYLFIFSKMLNLFGHKNQLISGKQLISIWRGYIPNVARIYDYYILTEMCNFGLIRRINSQKYIFYGGKANEKLKKLNRLRLW